MKCKVQKLCGGCLGPNVNAKALAEKKKEDVQQLMDRYHLNVTVGDVFLAKNSLQYRNKVIVGFAKDKERKVYSGLYAPRSHKVINTQGCAMHPSLINRIIDKITELVNSMHFELYNERTGTGLLRHVLIRYAKSTDQVMVVFVTSQKQFPSRRNLVNELVKEFPQIKTVIQNINPRQTSVVMQDESIVLYGDGYITDKLCGLDISFSSSSFYQIHSEQCEVLYTLAAKMLDLKPTDTLLDTYCGVGTIGLTMARSVKQVTGVEINEQAIKNAIYNAKQNKIRNCRFVAMDSTRFMSEARKVHQHYDAIILDPPRAGTTENFIQNACALKPEKILYISCDPRTQARDLNLFRKAGYVTRKIELVDMFPQTEHIESLCVLEPRKEKSGKVVNRASYHEYRQKGTSNKAGANSGRPFNRPKGKSYGKGAPKSKNFKKR
jgi:23S rRNA (uracil1939-C5)-methyltransferase